MSNRVLLVGLDFGTTTSCAVVASATVVCNAATGRVELTEFQTELPSEPVFTPWLENALDETSLARLLDTWLAPVDRQRVLGGGAIITGLAAAQANAPAFARLIRERLQDTVIAIAEDPCLESWLAFMGNCDDLSRTIPQRTIVNLDIGGGTTNLAAGQNGEVSSTGSLFVGARHVQVTPGTYQIRGLSPYAEALLGELGIDKAPGDELSPAEIRAIVEWYLALLEDAVSGKSVAPHDAVRAMHQQVAFRWPENASDPLVTFSGGVGQLVYGARKSQSLPPTTAFGDLGIDLARGIVESPFWRRHLDAVQPTTLGRATVYGLLRYNTQISGNTIFVGDPTLLPCADLLVLGTIRSDGSPSEIDRQIGLASRAAHGACWQVELIGQPADAIRLLAAKLHRALAAHSFTAERPLVLLVKENLGKVLGQYITDWGASPQPLVVIDEIEPRDVQFAHLGALRQGFVPVSFYGMNPAGGST